DDHVTVRGLPASLSATIYTEEGADSIDINRTSAGSSVTVYAGNDNDTVHIARSSGNLSQVAGSVTVDGGIGSDTLTLWDTQNTTAATYTVTSSTVRRSG